MILSLFIIAITTLGCVGFLNDWNTTDILPQWGLAFLIGAALRFLIDLKKENFLIAICMIAINFTIATGIHYITEKSYPIMYNGVIWSCVSIIIYYLYIKFKTMKPDILS